MSKRRLWISLSVFSSMRVAECEPEKYTFPPLIKCCAFEMSVFVGVGVHGLYVKYGVVDDVFVGSSLADFYGKCMLVGDTRKVFDEMPERNDQSKKPTNPQNPIHIKIHSSSIIVTFLCFITTTKSLFPPPISTPKRITEFVLLAMSINQVRVIMARRRNRREGGEEKEI